MKRAMFGLAAALMTSFLWTSVALSAQVVGIVKNADGAAVEGVRIRAVNSSGKTVGQGVTGPEGRYVIANLPNGQYVFKLDPLATGVQLGDGVGYLSDKGLTVDWKVSPNAIALDDATTGTTAAGSSMPDWIGPAAGALVSGVVIGGTLGGLAAAGRLNGGGGGAPPVASPAL